MLRDVLLDALADAVAVLLPVECAGCGEPDRALCANCRLALDPHVVERDGPGGVRVHTALVYDGEVRRVILAFKEQGRTDATAALARALGASVDGALTAAEGGLVVPVPSSRAAYRRRGYDPVARLLRLARVPHAPVLATARTTGVQKSLGVEDRAANLLGAFVATRRLTGIPVVLVDDVLTSGATLGEAFRAVCEAGGEVAGAATLAFTKRVLPIRDKFVNEDYGWEKGA